MDSRATRPDANDARRHLVDVPRPADGIGNALRTAFRGRLNHMPPEISDLLEKLS